MLGHQLAFSLYLVVQTFAELKFQSNPCLENVHCAQMLLVGCCQKNGNSALSPPQAESSPRRFATPGSIRVAEIDGPNSLDIDDILTEDQAIHEKEEYSSTQQYCHYSGACAII